MSDGEHRSPLDDRPGDFDSMAAAIGVFRTPTATMPVIAAARPWLLGLGLYIAIGVLSGLASLTTPLPNMADLAELPPEMRQLIGGIIGGVRSPLLVVGGALVLNPLALVIATGIFYGVGYLFGGRGHFSALLATVAFAALPTVPLALLTALLNLAGPSLAPLTGLLNFGAGIWTLVLQVLAVRASLALSTGRAVATILVPFAVLIVLACVLAVVVVTMLVMVASSSTGRP